MREIPLTHDQIAFVDDADFERLNAYKWFAQRSGHTFYAARMSSRPDRCVILMHCEIMGENPGSGYEVDHQDGSGINNQRANLRWVTRSQNKMNQHRTWGSSIFKGVSWHSSCNKWQAAIRFDGKRKHLGLFISEEDAARAYDTSARQHFGEFVRTNYAS